MKKLLAISLLSVMSAVAFAQTTAPAPAHTKATPEQRAAAKAKWDAMTPEEQAAVKDHARDNMKEKWDAMTPEEQEAAKARAKAKWDSMTPEQQAAAKKRFAERRAGKRPASAAN